MGPLFFRFQVKLGQCKELASFICLSSHCGNSGVALLSNGTRQRVWCYQLVFEGGLSLRQALANSDPEFHTFIMMPHTVHNFLAVCRISNAPVFCENNDHGPRMPWSTRLLRSLTWHFLPLQHSLWAGSHFYHLDARAAEVEGRDQSIARIIIQTKDWTSKSICQIITEEARIEFPNCTLGDIRSHLSPRLLSNPILNIMNLTVLHLINSESVA